MINLKHANAIITIVQEGSITAAAKRLFVSQPALSQTIRQVEAELGSPIFRRDTHHIELTHAGQLYMDAVQQILKLDRNLHTQIEDTRDTVYGELRVGISTQRGLQLMPRVIPEFVKLYPHITVRLQEEGSDRLEHQVMDGLCDIAFITTVNRRDRLQYVLIENEQLVLIAARTTRLAQKYPDGAVLPVTEAQDEKFVVMSQGHSVRVIQDALFARYGMRPRVILETGNMEAAKGVAARADAVFLVPGVYVPDSMPDRDLIRVYRIENADFERHFYFCFRQGIRLTKYEKDMVRIVCRERGVPCALEDD